LKLRNRPTSASGQVTPFGNCLVHGRNGAEAGDPDLVVCVRFLVCRDPEQTVCFRPLSAAPNRQLERPLLPRPGSLKSGIGHLTHDNAGFRPQQTRGCTRVADVGRVRWNDQPDMAESPNCLKTEAPPVKVGAFLYPVVASCLRLRLCSNRPTETRGDDDISRVVGCHPGNAMPAALRIRLRPPSHPTRYSAATGYRSA